jgi:hypothetical protein
MLTDPVVSFGYCPGVDRVPVGAAGQLSLVIPANGVVVFSRTA